MSSNDCYFDVSGCLVCPEIPPTPAARPQVSVDQNIGWNAGANSIAQLAGDVSLSDDLDTVPNGLAIGLRPLRLSVYDPSMLDHAFLFTGVSGHAFIAVMERGKTIGQAQAYVLGTKFEIRRQGSNVYYLLGNALLAKRVALTREPLIATACLYAAGDELP